MIQTKNKLREHAKTRDSVAEQTNLGEKGLKDLRQVFGTPAKIAGTATLGYLGYQGGKRIYKEVRDRTPKLNVIKNIQKLGKAIGTSTKEKKAAMRKAKANQPPLGLPEPKLTPRQRNIRKSVQKQVSSGRLPKGTYYDLDKDRIVSPTKRTQRKIETAEASRKGRLFRQYGKQSTSLGKMPKSFKVKTIADLGPGTEKGFPPSKGKGRPKVAKSTEYKRAMQTEYTFKSPGRQFSPMDTKSKLTRKATIQQKIIKDPTSTKSQVSLAKKRLTSLRNQQMARKITGKGGFGANKGRRMGGLYGSKYEGQPMIERAKNPRSVAVDKPVIRNYQGPTELSSKGDRVPVRQGKVQSGLPQSRMPSGAIGRALSGNIPGGPNMRSINNTGRGIWARNPITGKIDDATKARGPVSTKQLNLDAFGVKSLDDKTIKKGFGKTKMGKILKLIS